MSPRRRAGCKAQMEEAITADSAQCLYCSKSVSLVEKDLHEYESHLKIFHKIKFRIEDIIKQTVQERKGFSSINKENSDTVSSTKEDKKGSPSPCKANNPEQTFSQDSCPKPDLIAIKNLVVNLERIQSLEMLVAQMNKDEEDTHDNVEQAEEQKDHPPSLVPKSKVQPGKDIEIQLPWYFGCEYRCLYCAKLYFYVEYLRRHIKNEHERYPDDYLDDNGLKDYETKAVYWRCLVCDEIIKRHFTSISRHVVKHDLTLEQYSDSYCPEKFWEVSSKGPLGKEHKDALEKQDIPAKRRKTSVGKPSAKAGKRYIVPKLSPLKKTEEEDLDMFENFQPIGCNAENCNESFTESKEMMNHILKCHQLTAKFAPCFRSFFTPETFYKCQLCDVKVSLQKSYITKHLSKDHNLSFDDYRQKVLIEKKHKKLNTSNYNTSDFFEWFVGGCIYACFVCCEEIKGSSLFWKHVKESHNMNRSEYTKENGDSLLVETSMTCALCLEEILHEEESLSLHFRTAHQLTPREYFLQNVINGDKPRVLLAKLYNSSYYDCQLCDFGNRWLRLMRHHVRTTHSFDWKIYSECFNKSLVETAEHKCIICQTTLLLCEDGFVGHLQTIHKMKAKKYYENYYAKDVSEIRGQSNQQAQGELTIIGSLSDHPSLQTKDEIFKSWLLHGTINCPNCDSICLSQKDLQNHLINFHKDHSKILHIGKPCKQTRCQICGKNIPRTLETIDKHVKTSHSLTIEEYYFTHIRIPFTFSIWRLNPPWMCKICDYTDVARELIENHLKADHNVNDISMVKEVKIHECEICHAKINHDQDSLQEHAETHSLSLKTYYVSKISSKFPSNLSSKGAKKISFPVRTEVEGAQNDPPSTGSSENEITPEQPTNGVSLELESSKSNNIPSAFQHKLYDIPSLESYSIFLPALQPSEKRFGEFNKCIFYCRVCNVKFSSFEKVKSHLSDKHLMSLGNFLERHAPLNWEISMYSCPICKQEILQDLYIVETHMVTKHDSSLCTLINPTKTYNAASKKISSVGLSSSKQTESSTNGSEAGQRKTLDLPLTGRMLDILGREMTHTPGPKSNPAKTHAPNTLLIQQTFNSPTLQLPVSRAQKIFPSFTLQQQTASTALPVFQSSPQTQFSVTLPAQSPTIPFSTQNSASLQIIPLPSANSVQITQQSGVQNQVFVAQPLQTSFDIQPYTPITFVQPFQAPPAQSNVANFVSNFETQATEPMNHSTTYNPIVSERQKRVEELRKSSQTSKTFFRWNNCLYYCDLCESAFLDVGNLEAHVEQKHLTSMTDYCSSHKVTEQEVLHTCLVCNTQVKCTKECVIDHLVQQHEITLQVYEKEYSQVLFKIFENLKEQLKFAILCRKKTT